MRRSRPDREPLAWPGTPSVRARARLPVVSRVFTRRARRTSGAPRAHRSRPFRRRLSTTRRPANAPTTLTGPITVRLLFRLHLLFRLRPRRACPMRIGLLPSGPHTRPPRRLPRPPRRFRRCPRSRRRLRMCPRPPHLFRRPLRPPRRLPLLRRCPRSRRRLPTCLRHLPLFRRPLRPLSRTPGVRPLSRTPGVRPLSRRPRGLSIRRAPRPRTLSHPSRPCPIAAQTVRSQACPHHRPLAARFRRARLPSRHTRPSKRKHRRAAGRSGVPPPLPRVLSCCGSSSTPGSES